MKEEDDEEEEEEEGNSQMRLDNCQVDRVDYYAQPTALLCRRVPPLRI